MKLFKCGFSDSNSISSQKPDKIQYKYILNRTHMVYFSFAHVIHLLLHSGFNLLSWWLCVKHKQLQYPEDNMILILLWYEKRLSLSFFVPYKYTMSYIAKRKSNYLRHLHYAKDLSQYMSALDHISRRVYGLVIKIFFLIELLLCEKTFW